MRPLSGRYQILLTILTGKVRFLSEVQIARALWKGNTSAAGRALRTLAAEGWVVRQRILSHPEITLAGPLLVWKPGDPALTPRDFGQASYLCKCRWNRPPVHLPVWLATPYAAAVLGGMAGFINLATTTHDLHMGRVYLAVHHYEQDGLRFVREDLAESEAGERLPDLMLTDAAHRVRYAVEFGGAAKPHRIEMLYRYASRYHIPFELW